MTKLIYLAGDMLSHGQQLRRAYEKSAFKRLDYEVYNPQDDKSINDKSSADQQGLAERIVTNDTSGIEQADIIVLDYLPHAQGTICELGYIQKLKREKPELKVYVHCTDMRQGTGHIPDEQDRAEFSINQYVYGVILEVTEGRGVQDFEGIRQTLENDTPFTNSILFNMKRIERELEAKGLDFIESHSIERGIEGERHELGFVDGSEISFFVGVDK
ncbi:nucleoside 2-deoxyribosyltransferase [Staphylococcus sp. 18_1_E_LY]|uniref:Nucleoside 2-deoxyribosyltransferase n=1 Tax=Staphylococcus lloydii TaxID=2781774 RepID=A0A7T1F992_9STAP|nr:nucleoside 2-deoxyribosyltransferase [Staphylococcus lloydii]MBF7019642.1 nucleoside 2-deoxyribosyltransferase [Staphylococcus lloydii]MBF7027370.1 nucleoside 2-deoxyribosyltransferase [Staphylococcus lloydii]MDU9418995.1 nucleoside 2-deoxyribosyltransferase [Staphylococcus lloydii]QPM75032.1 nucleoside 2-deoxyribosyltransferase [Staphylococcus lloydii]